METQERLISPKELADRLGVKPSWVYARTRRGMPMLRLGRHIRFQWDKVWNWINEQQIKGD